MRYITMMVIKQMDSMPSLCKEVTGMIGVSFLQHEHERNKWGEMYEDVMVVDMNYWKE